MTIPKKQRSYPRLTNIKDNDVRETTRLLWDQAHDHDAAITSAQTSITAAQSTIETLQAQMTQFQNRLTEVQAGGGIATRSTVGGGGSGGTGAGSSPGTPGGGTPQDPPTDIPNQSGAVAQAKADLIQGGIDIQSCTPGDICCGPWQITNTAAFRLGGNYGLFSKTSGQRCNGTSTDIIAVKPSDGNPKMPIYDVLIDAGGANDPTWGFKGFEDTAKWVAPSTPPI